MWLPCLHVRAKGKTQGGLAEGKVILQFAFKAVVRIMCVYTCKCAYMCVHRIHVCTHVYVWGCVTACVYMCVCTCVHVYCIYVCTCVYMSICVRVFTPGCACVYMCTCVLEVQEEDPPSESAPCLSTHTVLFFLLINT